MSALMMFDTTPRNGGYVRFGMRDMSVAANNKASAVNIVRRHRRQRPSREKSSSPPADYANTLYEAWLYITGRASWAGMADNADYAGNSRRADRVPRADGGFAYQGSANGSRYNGPIRRRVRQDLHHLHRQQPPGPAAAGAAATDPAATTFKPTTTTRCRTCSRPGRASCAYGPT